MPLVFYFQRDVNITKNNSFQSLLYSDRNLFSTCLNARNAAHININPSKFTLKKGRMPGRILMANQISINPAIIIKSERGLVIRIKKDFLIFYSNFNSKKTKTGKKKNTVTIKETIIKINV